MQEPKTLLDNVTLLEFNAAELPDLLDALASYVRTMQSTRMIWHISIREGEGIDAETGELIWSAELFIA